MNIILFTAGILAVIVGLAVMWSTAYGKGKRSQEPRIESMRARQRRLTIEREEAVMETIAAKMGQPSPVGAPCACKCSVGGAE